MKKAIVSVVFFVFCIAPVQNAWAKANIQLSRLGAEVGLVDPESAGSTIGFGAEADLGTLAPAVRVSTRLGYWSQSEEDFGAKATIHDINVGARVKYMFKVSSPKFQPYAGGGLGLHFFNTKVEVPAMDLGGGFIVPGFEASDSATKVGLDLGGGASTPISPKANLFGEMWYTLADIDQFSLNAGVSFALSK